VSASRVNDRRRLDPTKFRRRGSSIPDVGSAWNGPWFGETTRSPE